MQRYREEAEHTRDDELSASSHIKLIHDYFEKLSQEVDNKLFDSSFYKQSQLEIAKSLTKKCEIFKPLRSQDSWAWLHEASKCFHIHLRNASSYHEFRQKLKDLTQEVELLKEHAEVNDKDDVFEASEDVRKLLEKLLDLQVKVERLHETSHRVVPIHLRRLPCQQNQLIVSTGSFYDINDKLIEEKSEFFLLDNSKASRWKVKDKHQGREMSIPSLLFTIPPPDAGLIQETCKLRWHLISVWKFCVDERKRDLMEKLTRQINRGLINEMTSAQKSKILDSLNTTKILVSDGDNKKMTDETSEFVKMLNKYYNDVLNLRTVMNSRSYSSFDKEWSGHHSLIENLKEMTVYMKTYTGSVSSQICSKNHVVRHEEPSKKPHFKSCAYIERWPDSKPNSSKNAHTSNMMMMIYEVGNKPNFTSDPNTTFQPTLKSNKTFTSSLKGEVEEVVEERWKEVVEETQFTSQTIKETQRFFIRGVLDPQSGKNISSQRAIDTGIIDLKRGLYRNPVTKEDILIPEAMDRGLIVVEYSNKSVEMGELIKSGIFKTFTKKEVVSYVILSIKDPKTGRNVSVGNAIESGLIDQEHGRFVLNNNSGDAISIQSAIDKGFLEVKELNRHPIMREEPANVKVKGVYDIVGKQFIPLQQALRRDVMDKNTAALRNKATGEVIPLKEAVRRGLVLLEISSGNDSNSLKNFPVLKQEDFEEIVEGVAEGYSADPIVELMADMSDDSLFYDPSSNEQMSLKRAIISSRVGFNPLMVTLEGGSKFALHDALLNGILDLKGVNELLKTTGGKRSLLKLVEDERFDLNTGEYIDLATKQRKSLPEAVESKQINPSLIFYWDYQSQVATSLKGSLDNERLKEEKVFDFKNNDWVTMEEAVNEGLVGLEVNAENLMEKYSSLMLLKRHIPIDGANNELMIGGQLIADAIMQGTFDLGGLKISSDEGFVSLPRAVEKKLIDPETAKKLTNVARENDLNNFFVSHKTFDLSTSRMEHPTTGRKINFLQAINDGVINPNSIFMVDCEDGDVKSMKRMAAEGKFNLETGKVKDGGTGRERSLLDAMKNGLVKSSIDPDQYLDQMDTIESIVKSNAKNKYITLKSGEKMRLEDAIANGLVEPTTKMRKDGKEGGLVFEDEVDGDIATCFKEISLIKELLDRFQNRFIDLKNSKNPNLSDFENLRSDLESFRTDVDDVFGRFYGIDSKSSNFDKLKTSTDKLNKSFQKLEGDLDAEVNKRGQVETRINEALDRLIGLKESTKDMEDEMRMLNREASEPNIDLKTVIDYAQNMDLRLQTKLEELLDVENHCTDLMDFLRGPEIDPDNRGSCYRSNPNLPRITDTLKQVNASLNKMNSELPEFTSDLLVASKNQDELVELEESFLDKLVAMENNIANVNVLDDVDREEKSLMLKELGDLDPLFVELESLRKDLKELADETDRSFGKIGRPSNRHAMDGEDLERMRGQVTDMQAQLRKSMSEDENKKNRLQQLKDEISNLENASGSDGLSLDRRKLMQLGEGLMRKQRSVDLLRGEVEDAVDSKVALDEDLMDRLQQIDDKTQSRRDKVVRLSDMLKQFNEIKESLNNWMKTFVGRVSKNDDSRILRIKIPKLNEEKSSKEADLKKLNMIGGELMSHNDVTDRGVVHGDLMNINKKWDDVSALLNQYVVIGASSEIDKLSKYLDEAETKMTSLGPINIDRGQLIDQLESHQKLHSDLLAKKSMGGEMVDEYSCWLARSMDDEADALKTRLGALVERLQAVSQSSMSRLIYLEDAATMASHLDESLSDLKTWLVEVEADLVSMETNNVKNDPDKIYKMQNLAKTMHHGINDQSELMESLKSMGLELKDLCDEKGAEFVEAQVSRLVERYDKVKEKNKIFLHSYQDDIYNSNDEAYNLLLSIKNDLQFYEQLLLLSFHPSLAQSALLQQIDDLQTMHDDILKIAHVINQIQHEMTSNNSPEEVQLLGDLIEREKELETKTTMRKEELETTLKLVEEFSNSYASIMSAMQMIQDNLASQDFPGVESTIVSDQINELNLMEEDLHNVRDQFKSCNDLVDRISSTSDPSIVTELKKLLDNRDHIFSNVLEGLSVRRFDLNSASELSQKYGRHLENVAGWLPSTEDRLNKINKSRNAGLKSTNNIDLEKLCGLKKELMTSYDDVIKLKDVLSSFKVVSPLSTDVLSFEVKDIGTRFNALVSSINSSIDQRKVDQLDLLQPLIDRISTDQLSTTEQFWNAEMLKNELNQLKDSYFNEYPSDVVPIQQLLAACRDWQDRAIQLKDRECCIENLLRWFDEFKNELIFLRALRSQPPLLRSQVEQFESKAKDFERKADEGDKLTNDVKSLEGGLEADYLVNMLQENISKSGAIAEETERKLRDHSEEAEAFHSLIGGHSQRMSDIETSLAQQPIKSLDVHELERDLMTEKETLDDMWRHGAELKFYGRKQDSVAIHLALLASRLRWNKLMRRLSDFKMRSSDDATHKEKFRQQYNDLLKAFEDIGKRVNDKNVLKDLLLLEDEMSSTEKKLHNLNHTLRNMKSGGDDNDLHSMMVDLKKKWNNVHASLISKKNKLDLDLISSGKVNEAVKVQCDWLTKCIQYLDENQPLLGDLDTVAMLIDQYKNFQDDLKMHESLIESIRLSSPPPSSLQQLNSLWTEVVRLNDARRYKLQDAHGLASDFQEAVEEVRRILPEIEDGLKERGMNVQTEDQLMDLIDHHQKLYSKLCGEQQTLEKIILMSEEILENCHPSATRFMQYYLTITHKRWEQALMKSNNILDRLNESLKKFRGGATVVEDLWAWLSEAHQLLLTKSKDPPPLDLATVDALIRDHQDFHEDLINKNEEIEEIIRDAQANAMSKSQIQTLQNKWRSVWRLSVDRKKTLQETLDHLLEIESLNNFNFDEWRQRYNDWIRSNKLRVTDFFRKQDKQGYGTITRNQFVDGMITSKFPSNKMELNAVFDLFEDPSTGEMPYQLLIEALKSGDKMGPRNAKVEKNPSKKVDDEVVTQISRCQCRRQFAAYKLGEGKYQFGEKGRIYLLRFVNGVVMVRVGGGWVSLTEFLQNNDPCKVKNRSNIEIYKTLQERGKSTQSLNKSISGSTTSLNMSTNQHTPKRSRTPQQTTPSLVKKNASLNHSMTSLVSIKSKDSDPMNVNKSADSLKSPKPGQGQRTLFVPPKRVSTPRSEQLSAYKDTTRPVIKSTPTGQR